MNDWARKQQKLVNDITKLYTSKATGADTTADDNKPAVTSSGGQKENSCTLVDSCTAVDCSVNSCVGIEMSGSSQCTTSYSNRQSTSNDHHHQLPNHHIPATIALSSLAVGQLPAHHCLHGTSTLYLAHSLWQMSLPTLLLDTLTFTGQFIQPITLFHLAFPDANSQASVLSVSILTTCQHDIASLFIKSLSLTDALINLAL